VKDAYLTSLCQVIVCTELLRTRNIEEWARSDGTASATHKMNDLDSISRCDDCLRPLCSGNDAVTVRDRHNFLSNSEESQDIIKRPGLGLVEELSR
jgi:hypothetical protein